MHAANPARRARRITIVPVLAAVALAAACGGSVDAAPEPTTTSETTASTTSTAPPVPVPTWPLTGEVVATGSPDGRPALVVKIDNVDSLSRPQAGINQADLVFEEKIEGPVSRFAAVFHSQDAPELGPVRSGRSTDVAIVSALNVPLYAFSGANEVMIRQLRAAPLVDIGYDVQPRSYDRKPGRPAPDNVFTSTERLWALTPDGAGPPPVQLHHRGDGDPAGAGGEPVQAFGYSFGGGPVGQPVRYEWDDALGGWARTQKGTEHVDIDGVRVAPPNVIVQFVEYVDTGLVDLSGTPVPEAQLVGSGDAWVFTAGEGVRATWSKPDPAAVTTYTDASGDAVALTPGRTWIALVPVGGDFSVEGADGRPLS